MIQITWMPNSFCPIGCKKYKPKYHLDVLKEVDESGNQSVTETPCIYCENEHICLLWNNEGPTT